MANNLTSRITALEQQTRQDDENYFVVICKGNAPTPEQKVEAAQHERVLLVTFPLKARKA